MLSEAISRIDCAEELFDLLGQSYDPKVLQIYRLHILKRFGLEVAMLERRNPPLEEDERSLLYSQALSRAHDIYAQGGGDAEPLIRPGRKQLVELRRPTHP